MSTFLIEFSLCNVGDAYPFVATRFPKLPHKIVQKIASAEVITSSDIKKSLLVIGSRGIGKRTSISEFKGQHRGGKGVKIAPVNDKFGEVAFVALIDPEDQGVVITSSGGQVVRIGITEIPPRSRTAKGVILMRLKNKEEVVVGATLV
jgi:DNA gyrase subunit A